MSHELVELQVDSDGVRNAPPSYYKRDLLKEGDSAAAPTIQLKHEAYRPFQPRNVGLLDHGTYGPKRVLGNSHMVCCCILTGDSANSIATAIIMIAVVLIFAISVVPRGEIYSYVIVAVFSLVALTCLTLSVTVDPGILLPVPPDPERHPTIVLVNGNEVLCKVCPTCHIVRPPRSSHCRSCNYCVEEFDHHCGVLGSCVAKRTFRFFGGFFLFASILVLFIGIRSMVVISTMDHDVGDNVGRWALAAALICIVAAVVFGCVIVPLAFYYVYLACLNSTQKEVHDGAHRPFEPNTNYHQGYSRNFWLRYFGPLGKSRITAENTTSYI